MNGALLAIPLLTQGCGKRDVPPPPSSIGPNLGTPLPPPRELSPVEILAGIVELATPAFRGFKVIATLGSIALKYEKEILKGWKIGAKFDLETIRRLFLAEKASVPRPSPQGATSGGLTLKELIVTDHRSNESFYFPIKVEADHVLCISRAPLTTIEQSIVKVVIESDETLIDVLQKDNCVPFVQSLGLVLLVSSYDSYGDAETLVSFLGAKGFDAAIAHKGGKFHCYIDVDPRYTADPNKLKNQVAEVLANFKTSIVRLEDLLTQTQ